MSWKKLLFGTVVLLTMTCVIQGTQAQLAESPWPKFQYDLQNTGRSPYIGAQDNALKWVFDELGYTADRIVIAADGTIYVTVKLATENTLSAVNPDGTLKWSLSLGMHPTSALAVGADGTIYVGLENAWRDNRGRYGWYHAFFLRALSPDGETKWEFQVGEPGDDFKYIYDPAVGQDGTIYFGCADNSLYALNPDGTIKWKFKSNGSVLSGPAISDGTLYFGSWDNRLYALNLDGTLKWSFEANGKIWSSPAISADGTIYFGCNGAVQINTSTQAFSPPPPPDGGPFMD